LRRRTLAVQLRETHAAERHALELRVRARGSSTASTIASIGQTGGAMRVLAVGTPATIGTAAGTALSAAALNHRASTHRSNDMFAMRSALTDAKRRLAQQRERMRENGILSP
jgi:hypothetical protein